MLMLHAQGKIIAEGRAVGHRIGAGTVKVIHDIATEPRLSPRRCVCHRYDRPDWEPIAKKRRRLSLTVAGAFRHAAIIARELGIPAVVGCGDATERMKDGESKPSPAQKLHTGYAYADMLISA